MYSMQFVAEATKAVVAEIIEQLERDSTGYFIRVAFTDGNTTVRHVKCYVAPERLEEVKCIAGPPIHKLKGDPEDIIKEKPERFLNFFNKSR